MVYHHKDLRVISVILQQVIKVVKDHKEPQIQDRKEYKGMQIKVQPALEEIQDQRVTMDQKVIKDKKVPKDLKVTKVIKVI